MDIDAITKAVVVVGTSLGTALRIGGRRRRLRNEIKDNLSLYEEVEKHEPLRQHLTSAWLQGRIALDIAKLTGQDLGTSKKPIDWTSVVIGLIFTAGFGFWTYAIDRHGFVWYSVFPGVVAAATLIAVTQSFTSDREIPPEDQDPLPPGAVRARSETASERIATAFAIAASGGVDDRLEPGHQGDVVMRFVGLMQLGAYGPAIELATPGWLLCRVQAWVWNNRADFGGDEPAGLQKVADAMLDQRESNDDWNDFVVGEAAQFRDTWGSINLNEWGIASRRRRVSRSHDVVVLAYVGASGGFFVTSATALMDALSFLVEKTVEGWLIDNHLGIAPPTPGWPPVWWQTGDPDLDALPET